MALDFSVTVETRRKWSVVVKKNEGYLTYNVSSVQQSDLYVCVCVCVCVCACMRMCIGRWIDPCLSILPIVIYIC